MGLSLKTLCAAVPAVLLSAAACLGSMNADLIEAIKKGTRRRWSSA